MRMKYYLRGMGVGIVVTVLLFMVALIFYSPEISDEEVIRRAKLLGMVESDESQTIASDMDSSGVENLFESDLVTNESANDDQSAETTDEVIADEESVATDSATADNEQSTDNPTSFNGTSSTGSTASDENASSQTSSSSKDDTVIVTSEHPTGENAAIAGSIVVRSGDSSESVSKKLVDGGFVDNATKFNEFLVSKHYDRILQNGTYDIPEGASYEDIAKIITKKQ